MMKVDSQLAGLERAQLVRRLDSPSAHVFELAYVFKHILVQETTYASLLKHDRQRLHRAVAQTLERENQERLDEIAARLEQHYAEADDDAKTLEYATRAGDYAFRMYANAEAIQHYTLALAKFARRGDNPAQFSHLYLQRGRAYELMGRYSDALDNYCALENEGIQRGAPALQLAGVLARATVLVTPTSVYDPVGGERLNAQALALAEELGDRQAECRALWNAMLVSYFREQPQRAVAYGERALALARELGLRELTAYILNDLNRPLLSVGPIERVFASLEKARTIWQADGNLPMLADNFASTAQAYLFAGDFPQAEAFAEQAHTLARNIANYWNQDFAMFSLMYLAFERGDFARIQHLAEIMRESPERETIMFQFGANIWRLWLYAEIGDYRRVLEIAQEFGDWARNLHFMAEGIARSSAARALIALGDVAAADRLLDQVRAKPPQDYSGQEPILFAHAEIELALARKDTRRALAHADALLGELERLGLLGAVPETLYLKANALALQDDLDAAANLLQDAQARAERLESRRLRWRILAALAEVERGRGNPERAQTFRAQAHAIVNAIADRCPPEWRGTFLAQPAVRALLDGAEPA